MTCDQPKGLPATGSEPRPSQCRGSSRSYGLAHRSLSQPCRYALQNSRHGNSAQGIRPSHLVGVHVERLQSSKQGRLRSVIRCVRGRPILFQSEFRRFPISPRSRADIAFLSHRKPTPGAKDYGRVFPFHTFDRSGLVGVVSPLAFR